MTQTPLSPIDAAPSLSRTPLHALHLSLGAKMMAFAGYDMPLHYPAGVLKEHLQTRSGAGLFDVSHMGQLSLSSADPRDVARGLETLIPIDIETLPVGRQRYGFLLSERGGILDDLMVANLGRRIVIVVNAANKTADMAYLRQRLPREIEIDMLPSALLALQGPHAEAALVRLAPVVRDMAFMDVREETILGAPCVISRSGYTGEDGFELSVPAGRAVAIAETLLGNADVAPVGLGARDSLRLEAGLCLHGFDMDAGTTPVEASLTWAISTARHRGGAREGGFPGADRILAEMEQGPSRRRVGLRPEGRAPVRAGAALFATEDAAEPVGRVTSGGFGASLQAPVAMGTVPTSLSEPGGRLFAEVRGQRLSVTVCRLPFVPARFKRAAGPA